MNVKIADVMSTSIVHAQPHQSVAHVRGLLENNHLHAVPVLDSDGHPVGIVSAFDLMAPKDGTPIQHVMTERVYTIPQYNKVSHAARLMRNHHIHHVVVTHEQTVVGMLSSFDLLQLVEDHRFVAKPGPKPRPKQDD